MAPTTVPSSNGGEADGKGNTSDEMTDVIGVLVSGMLLLNPNASLVTRRQMVGGWGLLLAGYFGPVLLFHLTRLHLTGAMSAALFLLFVAAIAVAGLAETVPRRRTVAFFVSIHVILPGLLLYALRLTTARGVVPTVAPFYVAAGILLLGRRPLGRITPKAF